MFISYKNLLMFGATCSALIATNVNAENTYTIITSNERTFLLNTKTGKSFRYFYNSVGKQGWDQITIDEGIDDGEQYYRNEPEGKLLSYSIQKPEPTPEPKGRKIGDVISAIPRG